MLAPPPATLLSVAALYCGGLLRALLRLGLLLTLHLLPLTHAVDGRARACIARNGTFYRA
jgi:hypothetical protein